MRTNIDINDGLLLKAQKLSGIKTKKAIVEKALQLLIQLESQKKILDLWGKVELDDKAFE
ncbi:type II toxin-antitoxin system VapB family antitoxin [Mucilaginibacter paludis]|nr:type II toxin-antitoxin system VapB family antitoxin [Mucilaginibacter paludis]